MNWLVIVLIFIVTLLFSVGSFICGFWVFANGLREVLRNSSTCPVCGKSKETSP